MKATETKLLDFLKGPKQFIIPIYQRTYSWTLKQCEQLWQDVLRAGTQESIRGHFIGSIVYIERGLYQISAIPQLLVIDGQQRLTTLTLLIDAYGDALRHAGIDSPISQKKLYNYYLLNPDEENEDRYKLLLTQSDRQTLLNLLDDMPPPPDPSNRVLENHNFFVEQMSKPGINLETIYNGIAKLIIVDIALNREHDNPQLIFESLNSTGLKLSQADLVRNYVLMGLEPKQQEDLYKRYWYPMERAFGQDDEASDLFDRFMRDYLTIKTGTIPNLSAVYEELKIYFQSGRGGNVEEFVSDIAHFADLYSRIAIGAESDTELKVAFADIAQLKVDVAYPFILSLYYDFEQGTLNREDFLATLRLIESYVFRRAICGIPTNSMNKSFAGLRKQIDDGRFMESLTANFLMMDNYRRFPDDEEFHRELVAKDIYHFRNRNYLLRKMENLNRKEKITVEDYTIEHILPQNPNLSIAWQQELGPNWKEVQTRYLHTLGNLTLTGYNPELSDRPFLEKRNREGGFADSPLRLNAGLGNLDHWNEENILNRAHELANKAISVWAIPQLSEDILQTYRDQKRKAMPTAYSISDYTHMKHETTAKLFQIMRTHILNLDASITEEMRKYYIAYQTTLNFVSIHPKVDRLRLDLALRRDEVHDPKGICRERSWNPGKTMVSITDESQLEDIMALVRQAYEKHAE